MYERNQGGPNNWGEVAKLIPSDGYPGDFFGSDVKIDSDVAVIGAPGGNENAGAAYVFHRDYGGPANWGEVVTLTASDPAPSDLLGDSVAVTGYDFFAGAPGDDTPSANSGSVYLYQLNCLIDADCDDADWCTLNECNDLDCEFPRILYGDVNRDTTVSIFDLFCILNGFGGDFSVCSFEDDDIAGGNMPADCGGDDTISIFDLFAVLNAFGGADPCCGK